MENFNNKGTKCPTLWLGTDKMEQSKAKTIVLELTTVRPDLDDQDFGGTDDSLLENNDKSDMIFCEPNALEQRLAVSHILSSLIGILSYLH